MSQQQLAKSVGVGAEIIKRSNSNLSNVSDDHAEIAFEDLEKRVGELVRSRTIENDMAHDFEEGAVDQNEVSTKQAAPSSMTGPPPVPLLGDENEKPSRRVGRAANGSPPINTILHTLSGVLPPPPRSSSPGAFRHPPLNVVPDILLEATKNSVRPPLTSRPSRPITMIDARQPSPPVKTSSPPIGRRTPPNRFGTEKRPSRRRLPADKRGKDTPSGPKEPTQAAAEFLKIVNDKLRESSMGPNLRPVYSTVRPIVCHFTNTPFYAQCSTAKMGWCTWCQALRPGNQKQGSICLSCGERLTAKYHRWYPSLVRLEPLERDRRPEMYRKYRPLFEHYNIVWHDEKQFQYVVQNYMLMKIYLSSTDFEVDALHLERAYMIGVFAGREFQTGAMARKLLREGCGLAMFRADFPEFFEVYLLREERAAVAEHMNQALFQGQRRAYFHAHHTNIEGWYDQNIVGRDEIVQLFKDLCNNVLQKNATQLHFTKQNAVISRSGTPAGERFMGSLPSEPNKEDLQAIFPFFSSVPNGMPIEHTLFGMNPGMNPMASPPMMVGPPPQMMNPPHGMVPSHPPQGPPIFSPVPFNPSSPINSTAIHPFYGMMGQPPQGPYGQFVRGMNSVGMTPPTPPPPINTQFERQFSGGSSVNGGTFVPHNLAAKKSR